MAPLGPEYYFWGFLGLLRFLGIFWDSWVLGFLYFWNYRDFWFYWRGGFLFFILNFWEFWGFLALKVRPPYGGSPYWGALC